MDEIIVYEQPLNERIRTFLRLEQLFGQCVALVNGETHWHSRATVNSLTGILEILSRTDVKTDILKELERTQANLSRLINAPGVDDSTLQTTLDHLDTASQNLANSNGQLGQSLRDIDILDGLVKRSSLIGGACSFDLPGYHYWLQLPAEQRVAQLKTWLAMLDNVQQPIKLLLGIIRESTLAEEQQAEGGFYQQTLNSNIPYQLIRVILPGNVPYYAEVSAGKHRFSIRFLQPRNTERALQVSENVPFLLSCCAV